MTSQYSNVTGQTLKKTDYFDQLNATGSCTFGSSAADAHTINGVMTGMIANVIANPSPKFGSWPAFTAASGTDTACSNGDRYWSDIYIPYNVTLTGLAYLIGSVGGTNNVIVELHDTNGVLLATSALAGTLVGTNGTMQQVPFTAPVAITTGQYYLVVQFNGTTAKFKTIPLTNFGMSGTTITGSVAGTFGTSANISPALTFTDAKGPIVTTY